MSAVTGLTVWGVLLLGVAATGTGALSRVPMAVLTADLLHATEGRSVLLIAHERDGLNQVDHIVVLDHGRERQLVTAGAGMCVAVSWWEDAMPVYTTAERELDVRTGEGPAVTWTSTKRARQFPG